MVHEISVKVPQSNGWQVCVSCVSVREREKGRVRDPSFWQIRFKDLPYEMLHRCAYRSVFSTAYRWVDVVQWECMFGEREHALLLLTN